MQSSSTRFQSSTIHFLYTGHGKNLLFCLHGHGESAQSFTFLENYCPPDAFTIIAIDLPWHGETKWEKGSSITPAGLRDLFYQILDELNIKNNTSSIYLLGFSAGGRVALSLYPYMADKIVKMSLLAPDGIKMNFWYWLATQTWLGNRLFAFTMRNPGWFLGFIKLMRGLRLVSSGVYKYAYFFVADKSARLLLYERWTSMRKCRPRLKKIKSLARKHQTPFRLVYGKFDRIILPPQGEKFRKGIEGQCTVTVITAGHQVLQEKYAAEIMEALLR